MKEFRVHRIAMQDEAVQVLIGVALEVMIDLLGGHPLSNPPPLPLVTRTGSTPTSCATPPRPHPNNILAWRSKVAVVHVRSQRSIISPAFPSVKTPLLKKTDLKHSSDFPESHSTNGSKVCLRTA